MSASDKSVVRDAGFLVMLHMLRDYLVEVDETRELFTEAERDGVIPKLVDDPDNYRELIDEIGQTLTAIDADAILDRFAQSTHASDPELECIRRALAWIKRNRNLEGNS